MSSCRSKMSKGKAIVRLSKKKQTPDMFEKAKLYTM